MRLRTSGVSCSAGLEFKPLACARNQAIHELNSEATDYYSRRMMRNKKRLVIAGLMLFTLLFISVELIVVASTSAQRRSHAEPPSVRVEDLYNNNCARCHGSDGRGDTPLGHTYNAPDFTDLKWWQENSDITSTGSLVSI